jgi:flavin reductase (DIM6/NTAB) family NADH-FMN oxidoreductase RutF
VSLELARPYDGDPVVAAADFRAAFRRHAAGVTVVTLAGPHGPVGFTATSVTSVSLDPPMLSFCLAHTSSNWAAVAQATYLSVNVLTEGQEELAARFATKGFDRFAPPTAWSPGAFDLPVLDGVAAWLAVRVERQVTAGDHTLLVGTVVGTVLGDDARAPLLHHDGRYARLIADPEGSVGGGATVRP